MTHTWIGESVWFRIWVDVRGWLAETLIGWALNIYHRTDPRRTTLARYIVTNWMRNERSK